MNATTPQPAPNDEASVERLVRGILQRLDRNIETGNNRGCSLFGLLLTPLLFATLWWGYDWSLVLAVGLAVGGPLLLWLGYWNWYDRSLARREAEVFNRTFPSDHPARPLALQMLTEMPYSSLANEKLRVALGEPRKPVN